MGEPAADDGGFGDFGATEAVEEPAADDGGCGDFGATEAVEEPAADDGGFGDFGATEAVEEHAADDGGFGDFGDFGADGADDGGFGDFGDNTSGDGGFGDFGDDASGEAFQSSETPAAAPAAQELNSESKFVALLLSQGSAASLQETAKPVFLQVFGAGKAHNEALRELK